MQPAARIDQKHAYRSKGEVHLSAFALEITFVRICHEDKMRLRITGRAGSHRLGAHEAVDAAVEPAANAADKAAAQAGHCDVVRLQVART